MPYSKNKDHKAVIYKIINTITGDFYIGSAWNNAERFRRHWTSLLKNKHYNTYLQRSVNKYGLSYFQFEIIRSFEQDQISRKSLFILEQQYIDNLKPKYNIVKTVQCGGPTEESKEKYRKLYSKYWILTNPDGKEIEVFNLKKFCRENNLSQGALWFVAQGRTAHYKNWKCRYKNK